MVEKIKTFKKITQQLFKHLDVKVGVEVKEEEGVVAIQLTTEEPGLLIGYHGETLAAIQLIISMTGFKKLGERTWILVNVGDYREKRKEVLERMAHSVAQKVKFSSQAQALPPMPSSERRIIHLALADNPEVETASEGEGKDRYVVVKPKS